MNTNKQEQKMNEIFNQLSTPGRIDVLAYTNTVLKAEEGIKKEYGLGKSPAKKTTRRKIKIA